MRSIVFKGLSRRLRQNNKKLLSIKVLEHMEVVLDVTANKYDLSPRLNNFKVPRKTLKPQLLIRGVILKDTKASVKQVEKKMCCLEYERSPLKKSNWKLIGRYAIEQIVVGGSAERSVKSVSIRFVGTPILISMAILRWCLRAIYEPKYIAMTGVGTERDVSSRILGVVFTLVTKSAWFHCPHSLK